MSRWFSSNFIQCLRCNNTQRMATGYKSISNPMLFNSEEQSRNYHNHTRISAFHHGIDITQKCEGCSQLHSKWNILTHNAYLDLKAKQLSEKSKSGNVKSVNSVPLRKPDGVREEESL